jgi:hypothetical protein
LTVAKIVLPLRQRAFSMNSPPSLSSGSVLLPRLRCGFAKKICRIRCRRSRGEKPPAPLSQQSVHSLSPGE